MPRVFLLVAVLSLIALAVRSIGAHVAAALEPPPGAPEPRDDEELLSGAFLHRVLMDAYGVERAEWALERVRRVEERLQAGRPAGERHPVEILWIPECTAFTALGPWVYVSRRLLERCPTDDALAMVVAHEIAHHDLGHMDAPLGSALLFLARRLAMSPEQERDADAHGFNLCLAAGYDPERCLRLFDILEADALDRGALQAVFGPEREIAAVLAGDPAWKAVLERWAHVRRRGYAPLRERKALLREAYLEAAARG